MAKTKFLDSVGLAHLFEKINAKFSKTGHTHTKAEITDFAHTHNDLYYGKTEVDSKLGGKANTGHNHDDRYYTESEINSKLANKSDTSHSHATHLTTNIAAGTDLNTVRATGISVLLMLRLLVLKTAQHRMLLLWRSWLVLMLLRFSMST